MDKEFLVVEKISENMAFCENSNRETVKIPLNELPECVKENDCIVLLNGVYVIDKELTDKRKQEALELTKSLFL